MLESIKTALVKGQVPVLISQVRAARDAGISAREILAGAFMPGMDEVGERFGKGELFIPEVMLAARAMQAGVDLLKEELAQSAQSVETQTIVIGTVQGDQHDIGKNLVKIMLSGAGYEVVDLGVNVPAQKFVDTAQAHGARLIALSALLTTTMGQMETVVKLAHEKGIFVMVGGAPVSQNFADKIGADGYARDAAGALAEAKRLFS